MQGQDFQSATLLRNPHLQTVWGRLTRPRRLVDTHREVFQTPDDDDLIVDHLHSTGPVHFVLFHGLEGSSNSVYIQGLLRRIADMGFGASAVNFRSCARDPNSVLRAIPNRQLRLYHSGETSDIGFILRALHDRLPDVPMVAFGGSLGGNALLKWLGENPEQEIIRAASVVSVPYDLRAGALWLERGAGPLYVRGFVRSLKAKAREKVSRFGERAAVIDLERLERARTFREIDDSATAPIHGFENAEHYWDECSSVRFVRAIRTPVLAISSRDDPFLPHDVIDDVRREAYPSLDLRVTDRGGHLGFVGGRIMRPDFWAERLVVEWLATRAMEKRQ
ncbi:MAG: alpha/beta fold hydrolase [Acidobacteria bacterium]|nr:alpha/beta fold hydrolase [Acidobacteriota bacterium]